MANCTALWCDESTCRCAEVSPKQQCELARDPQRKGAERLCNVHMQGMVHLTELSWNRVNHPDDVVQPGQQVQCRVLKVDVEKDHIYLSMKVLCLSH